jgi:ACR3 family arsenite efflux pump ArsB
MHGSNALTILHYDPSHGLHYSIIVVMYSFKRDEAIELPMDVVKAVVPLLLYYAHD